MSKSMEHSSVITHVAAKSAASENALAAATAAHTTDSIKLAPATAARVADRGSIIASGHSSDEGAPAYAATERTTSANAECDGVLTPAAVERVVDGDTLIVVTDAGERWRMRLIGVDTPESVAPEAERNCEEGRRASTWTHAHVPAGSRVWLQPDAQDEDDYGRKLRYVWLERPDDPDSTREFREKTLNAQLVAAGQAQAHSYPPNTTYDLLLQAIEDR